MKKGIIRLTVIFSFLLILNLVASKQLIFTQNTNTDSKEDSKNSITDKSKTEKKNLKKKNDEKNNKKNVSHKSTNKLPKPDDSVKKDNDLNKALPSKEDYMSVRKDYNLDEEQKQSSTDNLFWEALLILFIFIVIILLIYKFIKKRRNVAYIDTDIVKVLGTTTIALNKYLQVVEVPGKILIIGVGDHSVNPITEITDKEIIDEITLNASKNSSYQIKDSFNKIIGKFGINKSKTNRNLDENYNNNSFLNSNNIVEIDKDDDEIKNDLSFMEEQKKRLKNIDNNS